MELAKTLVATGKQLKDAELSNLLADLSIELSNTRMHVAELLQEKAALTEKPQALTSATGEPCP